MAFAASAPFRALLVALCLLPLLRPACAAVTEEQVQAPQGAVRLVHPEDAPKGLVLFLPGARGWDAQTEATAREVAGQGHLVAALEWSARPADTASCWDLGRDLAGLAQWLAGRESLPANALPILMGESEGAALVYAALLQSPPHRFHAAVTLGFCPRWPAQRPACRVGELTDGQVAGDRLVPAPQGPSAWLMLPGSAPSACPVEDGAAFAERVGNARPVTPGSGPKPTPGDSQASSPLASLMQWLDPRIPDQLGMEAAEADIAGLPLTEVRAARPDAKTFAVMLSGDGGWAAIDRGVSAELAAKGIDTVGWDSLAYFWKARTPQTFSRDLERVIRHYLHAWNKERVVLIGYSFGADALPIAANGLPQDLRGQVELAAFLGLGRTAMLEFHLTDWLDTGRGDEALPVLPQIQGLGWTRRLCVYGEDEEESLCPELTKLGTVVRKVRGDHHFDGDYPGVADLILGLLAGAPPAAVRP